jgi:Mg-chelatase subunit ChlD
VRSLAFLFPELLLLLAPLLALLFWRGRTTLVGGAVRAVIIVVLVVLAAVPLLRLGGDGVDVVAVVDLSRSVPPDNRTRALEVVKRLEELRGTGDRVGVVVYGREARVERLPEAATEIASFVQQVDPDGSDLGGAIALAASLIPPQRPGRIIVMSDGEANGSSVMAAAHDAAARGVPVDFRYARRAETADVAVESLDVPGEADEREPFQFSAWVRSDRSVEAEAVLLRDGVEVSRAARTFSPGPTQLTFRDMVDRPGVARYRLELRGATDRVPENNIGEGAVRIVAPAAILVVNGSGGPDNLSRALSSGKIPVRTTTPSAMPRDVAGFLPYRGVILENVSADALPAGSLTALTRFATDLGGGLLLTGGRNSFGLGGYFKSDLDQYLPVSMEIKNEHRKLSLAMVVVLDRSGSMAVPTSDGRTKMDLANLGTCAAIDTLGPFDEVGVIAVDSAAHVVVPLESAKNKDGVCNLTRTIQSMGGGIFTYTALVTAARMVQESEKGTRHIVLFADAADAEEPGEYQRLLERLQSIGITVSVIGLGNETDSDAEFLKDVAQRGGGRALFTTQADELPRLFAQEAITVARSSFVDQVTNVRTVADMVLLGELPSSSFPDVDGFNLTYLRPGATVASLTTDEHRAPILAFWHRGLGRVASLTVEVDGEFSQRLNAWPDFNAFTVGLGRWLLGGDPPADAQATLDRRGGEGIVRVELDPDRARGTAADTRTATAAIVIPDDSTTRRLDMKWVGESTLEARFPVQRAGTYLGAVSLPDGTVLPLSPISLPYSPEFEPRPDPQEGYKLLSDMARTSGGAERNTWDTAFSPVGLRDRQITDLILPLTLLVLLLHVGEIAGRRLLAFATASDWLRTRRLPSWRSFRVPRGASPAGAATPGAPAPATSPTRATAAPAQARDSQAATVAPSAAGASGGAPEAPAPPGPQPSVESSLARAKARARARLGD